MAQEIERKFLTRNEAWRSLVSGKLYRQGYITTNSTNQVWIHKTEDQPQLLIQSDAITITAPIPTDIALDLLTNLCYQPTPHQGQLRSQDGLTLRPRIAGKTGLFTIKTRSIGISRSEYEFEIPLESAAQLLDLVCDRPLIEKYRYKIPHNGLIWEVDEFLGDNQGLILAEVELASEDQGFSPPDWIDQEVSGDPRYFNSFLVKQPFKTWPR